MARNSPANTLDGIERVGVRVLDEHGSTELALALPLIAGLQQDGRIELLLGEAEGRRISLSLPFGILERISDAEESPQQIRERAELAEASIYARLEL